MRRIARMAWIGLAAAMLNGCMSVPLLENPDLVIPTPPRRVENNPMWVALGPDAYGVLFEKVLDVVADNFEVAYANRYDGTIDTFPRIAPGFEQPWKPGSPDARERLYATLQTIRHRAVVMIQTAEDGGFFVDVRVFKELEDLPRPIRATAGSASFRSDNTVDRQFEVIDAATPSGNWIPIGPNGRDPTVEQLLLQQMKKCLPGG